MVAASIEAEKAEVAAVDLSLEAALKRRSSAGDKIPVISSTLVKEKEWWWSCSYQGEIYSGTNRDQVIGC